MTSIKISFTLAILALFLCSQAFAQNIFKTNDARWVVGVEAIMPTGGFSVSKNISTGVVVEKPLGQFSVGLSIHYARTPNFSTNGYKFGCNLKPCQIHEVN